MKQLHIVECSENTIKRFVLNNLIYIQSDLMTPNNISRVVFQFKDSDPVWGFTHIHFVWDLEKMIWPDDENDEENEIDFMSIPLWKSREECLAHERIQQQEIS